MTVCDFCKVRDDEEEVMVSQFVFRFPDDCEREVTQIDICVKCLDGVVRDLKAFLASKMKTYED